MLNRRLKNVIFVEDDALDFEVYKSVLNKEFPELNVIQTLEVSPKLLSKYLIKETLLLVDVNLNGVDGIELYETQIKPLQYKVYIHTSSDNPADISRAKKAGIKAYFQKQLGREDISTQLTAILTFFDLNHIEN